MRILFCIFALYTSYSLATELSRKHLIEFYKSYGQDASNLTFGTHKAYFKERPEATAYAQRNGNRIAFSPNLIRSLQKSLTQGTEFTLDSQHTLLHEFAHTRQTIVNNFMDTDTFIQEIIIARLPFTIDASYKNELYADLFALLLITRMSPRDTITFYERERKQFEKVREFLENSNNCTLTLLNFLVCCLPFALQRDMLDTDDGEHLSHAKRLEVFKTMHDIAQKMLQEKAASTTYGTL